MCADHYNERKTKVQNINALSGEKEALLCFKVLSLAGGRTMCVLGPYISKRYFLTLEACATRLEEYLGTTTVKL